MSLFWFLVLKVQSEHPSVSHRGGPDHHAARDARQRQHFCSEGMFLYKLASQKLDLHLLNFPNSEIQRKKKERKRILKTGSERRSVCDCCLAASTGGKRGRVHPGNHRLSAEKLLGC